MEVLDFTFERRLELEVRDSWIEGFKTGFERRLKEIMGDGISEEVYQKELEMAVFESVSDKSIDVDKGAGVLDLSVKELMKEMEQAGYKLPE